jgi:hypothetical protein
MSDPSLVRVIGNDGSAVAFSQLTRAVGGPGGARGYIHGAQGVKSQVRLLRPSAMKSVLTPALGFAAITVALDMIAQQQQLALLEDIKKVVGTIRKQQLQSARSSLRAANDLLTKACAKVYDKGILGPENGVDSAIFAATTAFFDGQETLGRFESVKMRIGTGAKVTRLEDALKDAALDGIDEAIEQLAYLRFAVMVHQRSVLLQQAIGGTPEDGAFMSILATDLDQSHSILKRLVAVEDWFAGLEILPGLLLIQDKSIRSSLTGQRKLAQLGATLDRRRALPSMPASIAPAWDGGFEITALRKPDGQMVLVDSVAA